MRAPCEGDSTPLLSVTSGGMCVCVSGYLEKHDVLVALCQLHNLRVHTAARATPAATPQVRRCVSSLASRRPQYLWALTRQGALLYMIGSPAFTDVARWHSTHRTFETAVWNGFAQWPSRQQVLAEASNPGPKQPSPTSAPQNPKHHAPLRIKVDDDQLVAGVAQRSEEVGRVMDLMQVGQVLPRLPPFVLARVDPPRHRPSPLYAPALTSRPKRSALCPLSALDKRPLRWRLRFHFVCPREETCEESACPPPCPPPLCPAAPPTAAIFLNTGAVRC